MKKFFCSNARWVNFQLTNPINPSSSSSTSPSVLLLKPTPSPIIYTSHPYSTETDSRKNSKLATTLNLKSNPSSNRNHQSNLNPSKPIKKSNQVTTPTSLSSLPSSSFSSLPSLPSSSSSSLPFPASGSNSNSSNPSNSIPELVSSFQEPLVGLSPPTEPVQQEHNDQNHQPKPPPKKPVSNSNSNSTSLTTSPKTTREFRVLPIHAFHTHKFIKNLEGSGFGLGSSEEILNYVETSLRGSERRWLLTGPSGGIVTKSYVEGQAYLFNAALGELRTEVQVKARNDSIVLKSASNSVQREIDNLKQKLKEDIAALKNELQLELNGRKEEASDDQKKLELSIQELNSKFTILASEVRTEIETRKWVTTRRCVVAIASLALCVVIFTALENQQSSLSTNSSSSSSSSKDRRSLSSSSSSPPPSSSSSLSLPSYSRPLVDHDDDDQKLFFKDRMMRSVEELGILPERDDNESDYSSNSFFTSTLPSSSSSSSPSPNLKRVGE